MKLIEIASIKFGSAVMISGKQEASVTAGKQRKGDTKVLFDPTLNVYLVERENKVTIVHPTNVQYATPVGVTTLENMVKALNGETLTVEATENEVSPRTSRGGRLRTQTQTPTEATTD